MTEIENSIQILKQVDFQKCLWIRSLTITANDDGVSIECCFLGAENNVVDTLRFDGCYQIKISIPGGAIEIGELLVGPVTDAAGRIVGFRIGDELTGRLAWCCTSVVRKQNS